MNMKKTDNQYIPCRYESPALVSVEFYTEKGFATSTWNDGTVGDEWNDVLPYDVQSLKF